MINSRSYGHMPKNVYKQITIIKETRRSLNSGCVMEPAFGFAKVAKKNEVKKSLSRNPAVTLMFTQK